MHPMDAVFSLPEPARAKFLRSIVHSTACSYICLWAYQYDSLLSSNHLGFLDGLYNVGINQPSSSVGSSVAQTLFNQYRGLVFDVNDDRIPGLAFKNRTPYLELQQPDLLRLAWTQIQTQFYQEARIKTAVFMGCNNGEMELGFSTMSQADDLQTALMSWFPDDFSRMTQPNIEQNQNQNNPPSSSSSSLRSLSLSAGSPEYSSLLFTTIPPTAPSSSPHQQAIQALAQASQSPFPTPQIENDAIMRAILQVISSTSSPSSSTSLHHHHHHHQQQQQQQQQQQNLPYMVHPENSAFKRYSNISPTITSQIGPELRHKSMFKRTLTFFRSLNFMRMRERSVLHHQASARPTSTQLHHMISERRRREKLNENFQALRSLLPHGTKKDKASILTVAKETLKSLMAEIENLRERNKQLLEEASSSSSSKLIMAAPASKEEEKEAREIPNERIHIQVSHELPESSSSEERIVNLVVTVRGERSSQVDILIRLLGFLNQDRNLSLISMEANTHSAHGTSFSRVTLRLKIEGSEWDESAFYEAVRRVVADLAQ